MEECKEDVAAELEAGDGNAGMEPGLFSLAVLQGTKMNLDEKYKNHLQLNVVIPQAEERGQHPSHLSKKKKKKGLVCKVTIN